MTAVFRKERQQPGVALVFPVQVEIGNETRHEDEIERSLADHLIGDPHVAAKRVSSFDRPHEVCPPDPTISYRRIIAEAHSLRQMKL
ncbi:hypothetical protein NKJ40_19980 [Mesorhizobium sp. M0119]|uniref:hypothetical protein n=1 Tax=unclassified Mesorhizobium TaxID=325217 RepID=UPI0033372832